MQERLGWREFYPASIFDTYAATAQRTTRSRMIMTFESVCGWSNTCRVDAQRLRLKPRDRLTTENIPCTRQPRTRKGWVARASDSIVPRSEMARRRASGALSRGAPSYRFKERVGLCLVLRDYVTRIKVTLSRRLQTAYITTQYRYVGPQTPTQEHGVLLLAMMKAPLI